LSFLVNPSGYQSMPESFGKQVPSKQGVPLLAQEEWRALKEICKTT
jgi:hypothetical protein